MMISKIMEIILIINPNLNRLTLIESPKIKENQCLINKTDNLKRKCHI